MKSWQNAFLLGAGFGVTFLLGQWLSHPQPAVLEAQGRGAANPPPPLPDPVVVSTQSNPAPEVVYTESGGSGGSSDGFVAVTGSYGVGTSVLYVLDTKNRQLAVYEARGGSTGQRRLVLVGARRIDLDLQIESYNDRSEFDYPRLKNLFDKRGKADGEPEHRSAGEPEIGR